MGCESFQALSRYFAGICTVKDYQLSNIWTRSSVSNHKFVSTQSGILNTQITNFYLPQNSSCIYCKFYWTLDSHHPQRSGICHKINPSFFCTVSIASYVQIFTTCRHIIEPCSFCRRPSSNFHRQCPNQSTPNDCTLYVMWWMWWMWLHIVCNWGDVSIRWKFLFLSDCTRGKTTFRTKCSC